MGAPPLRFPLLHHSQDCTGIIIPERWLRAINLFCPSATERGILDMVALHTWGMGRDRVNLGGFAIEAGVGRESSHLRWRVASLYRPPADGGKGLLRLHRAPRRALAIEEDWTKWGWRTEKHRARCEAAMRAFERPLPQEGDAPWSPDPTAEKLATILHAGTLGCYPWGDVPRRDLQDGRWVDWIKAFERMLHHRADEVLLEVVTRIIRDTRLHRSIVGGYAPLAIERVIDDLAPLARHLPALTGKRWGRKALPG